MHQEISLSGNIITSIDAMVIILLLSILGFLNAFYLYWQHKREVTTGQKMFCLIGGDCGAVVGSKYGRTLGIKNETVGMVYYFLLGTYSLLSILIPPIVSQFQVLVKIAVVVAVIFSLYLLYAQTIILRKFCSWCLIAIAINILIAYVVFIF